MTESLCEVMRQHTIVRVLMLSLSAFWRLPVRAGRLCSVVNVNGDGGGSIQPEPHDVVLSTANGAANALHLLASSS